MPFIAQVKSFNITADNAIIVSFSHKDRVTQKSACTKFDTNMHAYNIQIIQLVLYTHMHKYNLKHKFMLEIILEEPQHIK